MPSFAHDGSSLVEGVLRAYDGSSWTDETDNVWAYDGATWQLIQPFGDSALNPPENLVVVDLTDVSATCEWDDPSQTLVPTHVQVRIPEETTIWTEYDYGTQSFTWPTLDPETDYQFQVRYVLRTDGIVTATSATSSVFFTTDAAEGPSLPAPDPGGGGTGSTIHWPIIGPSCDWQYIVQELDLDWIWVDTAVTGTQDGDIADLDIDFVALGIDCGTVCRMKYRENCGGVFGAYQYGGSFVVACDYTDDCGGVAISEAFTSAVYLDAILAMPQICWDEDAGRQKIEDFVTNQEYNPGPGYGSPGFNEDNWILNSATTNADSGTMVCAGYNSNLQDIDDTTDFSVSAWASVPNPASVGPQPSTKLVSVGKLLNIRAVSSGAGWKFSATFPKVGGGSFTLVSTTVHAADNEFHCCAVTIDQNGNKLMYVDGDVVATDADTHAAAFATLTSELELWGNDSARLGPVAAWDRVLSADEAGAVANASGISAVISGSGGISSPLAVRAGDHLLIFPTAAFGFGQFCQPPTRHASSTATMSTPISLGATQTWSTNPGDFKCTTPHCATALTDGNLVFATANPTNGLDLIVNTGRSRAFIGGTIGAIGTNTKPVNGLSVTPGAATAGGNDQLLFAYSYRNSGASPVMTPPAGAWEQIEGADYSGTTHMAGQRIGINCWIGPYQAGAQTAVSTPAMTNSGCWAMELRDNPSGIAGGEIHYDDGAGHYSVSFLRNSTMNTNPNGTPVSSGDILLVGGGGPGQQANGNTASGGGGGGVKTATGTALAFPTSVLVAPAGGTSIFGSLAAPPGLIGAAPGTGGASGGGDQPSRAGVAGTHPSFGSGGSSDANPGISSGLSAPHYGNGGQGTSNSWASGSAQIYGSGGGGGGALGGTGGGVGGTNAGSRGDPGGSGTANFGGGGGAGNNNFPAASGGNGGTGIVVVRVAY